MASGPEQMIAKLLGISPDALMNTITGLQRGLMEFHQEQQRQGRKLDALLKAAGLNPSDYEADNVPAIDRPSGT